MAPLRFGKSTIRLVRILASWPVWSRIILALALTTTALEGGCLAFPGEQLSAATTPQRRSGTIGEGTATTPWYRIDSGQPGPTVLVVGGIHGNEPSGYWAASQIQYWPIVKGSLIVLPQANRLGLAANMRWQPEHRNNPQKRDLNRNFPRPDRPEAATNLASSVWDFVLEQHPDWVFDLHEGFDVHRENPKSVGSSVIAFPAEAEFARMLVNHVNTGLPKSRHFDVLAGSGPAEGSLTRACSEAFGARSFILETTTRTQRLSTRVRQHRLLMSQALKHIGLIDVKSIDRIMPPPSETQQRIAVFDGPGAEAGVFLELLGRSENCLVCPLGPEDLRGPVLEQFDAIVFPGGSGSQQGTAIGETGRQQIREYLNDGGGVVGVCAGAYLCSSHYSWSLNVMNAAVYNITVEIPDVGRKSMWYRGKPAMVDVEFSDAGQAALDAQGVHSIRYHNGPILSVGNRPDLPTFETWAVFRSENGMFEAQRGTMLDTPAIVHTRYGEGRVIAISPHFESTTGEEDLILRAIQVIRRRQPVAQSNDRVR